MTLLAAIINAARSKRRLLIIGAIAFSGILLAQPSIFANRARIVGNAMDSAPVGLYAVADRHDFQVDDYAVILLPPRWRRFAAKRGYLPLGIPLVKRVTAIEGSDVCSAGDMITVDKLVVAKRLARDRKGRRLPSWRGCRQLGLGQIFLLNSAKPNSFDGRYFGPLQSQDAVGRGYLLWAA